MIREASGHEESVIFQESPRQQSQNKGGSVVRKASVATMNVVTWYNRAAGPGNGQRNAHRPREALMSAVKENSIKALISQ